MVGPLAYGMGPDPVAVAKVLNDFAKGNEKFVITGGAMPGQVMSNKQIAALASLPSREELIAKLLGTMQALPSSFASLDEALTAYRPLAPRAPDDTLRSWVGDNLRHDNDGRLIWRRDPHVLRGIGHRVDQQRQGTRTFDPREGDVGRRAIAPEGRLTTGSPRKESPALARSELTAATSLGEEQRGCWHPPEFSIVADRALRPRVPLRGSRGPERN